MFIFILHYVVKMKRHKLIFLQKLLNKSYDRVLSIATLKNVRIPVPIYKKNYPAFGIKKRQTKRKYKTDKAALTFIQTHSIACASELNNAKQCHRWVCGRVLYLCVGIPCVYLRVDMFRVPRHRHICTCRNSKMCMLSSYVQHTFR